METLIITGIVIVLVVASTIGLLSRYRKCPSDQILVVFGKAGHKKVTNSEGKVEEITLPSKIFHGGGTFVWPIIQDFKTMSLRPIQIQEIVTGLSSQNIKVTIPITLTTAIGTVNDLMQAAASRFLSATESEMRDQIKDILIGETRSLMATMTIEDINANRVKFLDRAKDNIESELNKIGFMIININTADISDEANYIKNLGKKAATQAQATAEADIAEQLKIGHIKIAETTKEEEIAVANADKERKTIVAQTTQEQEVRVAEINKEREIKLAEAEKDKQSEVANQRAKQAANLALAQAEADKARAAAQADAEANMARSIAQSEAAKQEANSEKEIRIANAEQTQAAETIKAIQEKEAKAAEYHSLTLQRKAEAEKLAGVAEQKAKIDVAKATAEAGQAEADSVKTVETAKVEAQMSVEQKKQERQLEVNLAEAKAAEAKLQATDIIPAQKAKEKLVIEAEAEKTKMILAAEAEAEKIRQKALADADAIRLTKEAEAEGTRKLLMAEAEGKRASLLAEAEALQQKELAPALAFEKMVSVAGDPSLAVQWKTVDHLEGIAGAQAEALSRVTLGNVTVYGDSSTGGQFIKDLMANVTPAIDMISSGMKEPLKNLFGKSENKSEFPEIENK